MQQLDTIFKAIGNVTIEIYDPITGEVKDRREITNKVVTTGAQYIARRMANVTDGVMTNMAVGTNNTAPDIAQTGLLGAIPGGVASGANFTTTVAGTPGNVIQFVGSFPAGVGTGAITEAGIFNAAALMLARTTFAVVNKSDTDAMSITWTITVTVV